MSGIVEERETLTALFAAKSDAHRVLRDFVEPYAREYLGDSYVDNPTGWQSWDVRPNCVDGVLLGVTFVGYTDDEQTKVEFYKF